MDTPKTLTFTYAVTDYQYSLFYEAGREYEVDSDDVENGTFQIDGCLQNWKKEHDIGFGDWRKVTREEKVPIGVFEQGFDEPTVRKIISVLKHVREKFADIDRDLHDARNAAWAYWFATAPRTEQDEPSIDPRDIVVSFAALNAGYYDAAVVLASEALLTSSASPPPSPRLQNFAGEVLAGRAKRPSGSGKQVRNNTDLRDPILIKALQDLMSLGINPTQNDTKAAKNPNAKAKPICGASLISEALEGVRLNEATIMKIWSSQAGQSLRKTNHSMPD